MIFKKFGHLDIPDHWEQYWSKYPNGYSILEAIINWVSQVDDMSENLTNMNGRLEQFLEQFDENLRVEVREKMKEMYDNGDFAVIMGQLNELVVQYKEETDEKLNVLSETMGNLSSELDKKITQIEKSTQYTVGEGGKFPTINSAIKELSKHKLLYDKNNKGVELLLLPDFVVREQVLASNTDLGWITISSLSSPVTVSRVDLIDIFGSENRTPLFGASHNATLPLINTLFVMDSSGDTTTTKDGLYIESNSSAIVTQSSGVINASGFGIRAFDGSRVLARGAIFTNAGERGCMISQGSIIYAPYINLSGAKGRNTFRAYRGVLAAIERSNLSNGAETNVRISEGCSVDMQHSDVSNAGRVSLEGLGAGLYVFGSSTVYAAGINADNAAGNAVQVSSGSVVAVDFGARLTNAGEYGVNAYGVGTVNANGADVSGAKGPAGVRASSGATVEAGSVVSNGNKVGLKAELGGHIIANSANAQNNDVGFQASQGGTIIGSSMDASGSKIGFNLLWEGEISARSGVAKNCSQKGAKVSTGSRLNITSGNLTGAGEIGLHAYRGSDVSAYGTQCRKGSTDSPTDIVCTTGSIVRANGVSGGFNKPVNIIDGEGLIFN